MSHYTKARPGGYYNDLLIGDDADFKKLLKKYSIAPPDNVGGYTGKALGVVPVGDGVGIPALETSTRSTGIDIRRVASGHKVAYIDLRLNARQVGNAGHEGDVLGFDTSFAATPNYVPVHFLPWDSLGAAIRLTIPASTANDHQGPTHGMDAANPFIFFTAAINGCSIFFRGTPQNPTIFHCGGTTYVDGTDEQAEFWEAVMDEFVNFDDERKKVLGALQNDRVDKRDYVTETGVTSKYISPTGAVGRGKTTLRAKAYQKMLQARHAVGKLNLESVNPWGCVVGRRNDNGDWTFYLQENATVTYHQISLNPIKRMQGGVKSTSYSVARPLIYKEIFPNGPGHVTIRKGLPTIH